MTQREINKKYRERHNRLGLCIWCSRKAKTGMVLCQVCLARTSERRLTRHQKFCPECKKLIKPEERHIGKRLHELCAQKRSVRLYPQQHRSAVIAYQRKHREMGLCTGCPKKVFKGSLYRKHYGKVLERYYERAAG